MAKCSARHRCAPCARRHSARLARTAEGGLGCAGTMAPRLGARVFLPSLLVITALTASVYGVTGDITGAPST